MLYRDFALVCRYMFDTFVFETSVLAQLKVYILVHFVFMAMQKRSSNKDVICYITSILYIKKFNI